MDIAEELFYMAIPMRHRRTWSAYFERSDGDWLNVSSILSAALPSNPSRASFLASLAVSCPLPILFPSD